MNEPRANASPEATTALPAELLQQLARQKQRRRGWLLAAAIVVLLAVPVAWWRLGTSAKDAVQFETDAVRRADIVAIVTATGTLQPTNQTEVGAEISGTVREVLVDYNDRVKRGTVLARLDTRRLEAQRRQTAAQLEAAKARLPELEATLLEARARARRLEEAARLSAGEAVSPHDRDAATAAVKRAEAALAQTQAQIRAIEAQLAEIDTNLDKSVIRSPVDGVVLQRKVNPGQTIAASLQAPVLFVIAEDLTQMELLADVDEADVGRVRAGQPVRFTVDAYGGEKFHGTVRLVRLGSEIVNGVVTYKTVITVANPDGRLRPGMTATAEIETDRRTQVLTLANAALRFTPQPSPETRAESGGGFSFMALLRPAPIQSAPRTPPKSVARAAGEVTVYVLVEGKPEARQVRLGLSDGRRSEILEDALPEGTPLIVREKRGTAKP